MVSRKTATLPNGDYFVAPRNGKNNVRVIDRSDIESSGGADPRQTLRQLGVSP
jgi:hypothetical protein